MGLGSKSNPSYQARFVILGMDEQCSDANDIGSLGRAEQRILEQRLAQPLSLLRVVDGKPGQRSITGIG